MGASVLIVDDSETLRSQVRNVLESAGFSVVEACNGKDGLSKLKMGSKVHLILCDVNMPEMKGITMCQEVHKDESVNKIPIVMLTTEASTDMKKAGKEAGVVAWMTKPIDGERLLSAVKKITGGR